MPDKILLIKDGDSWMAALEDFEDLMNSPNWWGDTPVEAVQAYWNELKLVEYTEKLKGVGK